METTSTSATTPAAPTATTAATKKCSACGNAVTTYTACPLCRDTYYCGVECQRSDWLAHRDRCPETYWEDSTGGVEQDTDHLAARYRRIEQKADKLVTLACGHVRAILLALGCDERDVEQCRSLLSDMRHAMATLLARTAIAHGTRRALRAVVSAAGAWSEFWKRVLLLPRNEKATVGSGHALFDMLRWTTQQRGEWVSEHMLAAELASALLGPKPVDAEAYARQPPNDSVRKVGRFAVPTPEDLVLGAAAGAGPEDQRETLVDDALYNFMVAHDEFTAAHQKNGDGWYGVGAELTKRVCRGLLGLPGGSVDARAFHRVSDLFLGMALFAGDPLGIRCGGCNSDDALGMCRGSAVMDATGASAFEHFSTRVRAGTDSWVAEDDDVEDTVRRAVLSFDAVVGLAQSSLDPAASGDRAARTLEEVREMGLGASKALAAGTKSLRRHQYAHPDYPTVDGDKARRNRYEEDMICDDVAGFHERAVGVLLASPAKRSGLAWVAAASCLRPTEPDGTTDPAARDLRCGDALCGPLCEVARCAEMMLGEMWAARERGEEERPSLAAPAAAARSLAAVRAAVIATEAAAAARRLLDAVSGASAAAPWSTPASGVADHGTIAALVSSARQLYEDEMAWRGDGDDEYAEAVAFSKTESVRRLCRRTGPTGVSATWAATCLFGARSVVVGCPAGRNEPVGGAPPGQAATKPAPSRARQVALQWCTAGSGAVGDADLSPLDPRDAVVVADVVALTSRRLSEASGIFWAARATPLLLPACVGAANATTDVAVAAPVAAVVRTAHAGTCLWPAVTLARQVGAPCGHACLGAVALGMRPAPGNVLIGAAVLSAEALKGRAFVSEWLATKYGDSMVDKDHGAADSTWCRTRSPVPFVVPSVQASLSAANTLGRLSTGLWRTLQTSTTSPDQQRDGGGGRDAESDARRAWSIVAKVLARTAPPCDGPV
jgi:hypothetical protein